MTGGDPGMDGEQEATTRKSRIVYNGKHVRVRKVKVEGARKTLITFQNVWDRPNINNPGFAEPWLAKRPVNAIYFTCSGNDWYQYPEMTRAVSVAAAAIAAGQDVLCYGLSMGGYAAIRFSGALGAHRVLALAPQYCISAERAPFERRWRREAARIAFIDEPAFAKAAPDLTIIYDPVSPDRDQVEAIVARHPAKTIPLRHAGHKVALILSEMNLLSGALASFVDDRLDGDELRAAYRARRATSALYLRHLGWAGIHLPRKARILKAGLKIKPHNRKLLEALANVELRQGNPGEARQVMERAESPRLAMVRERNKLYQEFIKRGLFDEAMAEARAIMQLGPDVAANWLEQQSVQAGARQSAAKDK